MLNPYLNASLIVEDWKCVTDSKLVVETKKSLARVDKVACVLPYMESNEIWMKKTLEKFFSLVKRLEHCWGGESLVKIEANVGFYFLTLADVVGNKHVLVAVDPDRVRVD